MLIFPENILTATCLKSENFDGTQKWWATGIGNVKNVYITVVSYGDKTELLEKGIKCQVKTLSTNNSLSDCNERYLKTIRKKEKDGYSSFTATGEGKPWDFPTQIPIVFPQNYHRTYCPQWTAELRNDENRVVCLDLTENIGGDVLLAHYEGIDDEHGIFNGIESIHLMYPVWQTVYTTKKAAITAMETVVQTRLKKGYRIIQNTQFNESHLRPLVWDC